MIKKLILKSVALIILLIILNQIYSLWFLENDLQTHSDIINQLREVSADAEIVYLGESSNNTSRYDDKDKRAISEFIGDYFPDITTSTITYPASHAGIYKVLLNHIPEDNNINTVIITLNLRSFNAGWIYARLETPLQKSMVLLKDYPPLLNRFFLSFKHYDIKTEEEWMELVQEKWESDTFDLPYEFQFRNVREWDYWMAMRGVGDKDGNYDNEQTILACHYIKAYAFHIDTLSNPRIQDFNDIVDIARDRGWNLVFNLVSENTDKAKEYFGADLIYFMNENVKILKNYYSNKGVTVVDNYNLIRNDQFIDQDWTTEHYAEKGRKLIAKNVANAIKAWHPGDFMEPEKGPDHQTVFYNNCDNGTAWGQMQTITDEISFSGEFSSVTGAGNDYSITLELPLGPLPDSIKNRIIVDLMLQQGSLNHDAKLVIQADGKDNAGYWSAYLLRYEIETRNKWAPLIKTEEIPEVLKSSDLLKVYLLNTSQEKVYVDDFRVTIE